MKVTIYFYEIASDKGLVSVLVLLEQSAAFDSSDHHTILQRLEHLISIKGAALSWFCAWINSSHLLAKVLGITQLTLIVMSMIPNYIY